MKLGPVSTPQVLLPSLDSVLEETESWVPLTDPGPPLPLVPRASPRLTVPTSTPTAQGVTHQSLASLPGPLLCLLPLPQPLPPDSQRGPAAPIPGPAGSQLSPGPVGCCPVAPAKEGAGKQSVYPEDGQCHQGPDQLSPLSPAGRSLGGLFFLFPSWELLEATAGVTMTDGRGKMGPQLSNARSRSQPLVINIAVN